MQSKYTDTQKYVLDFLIKEYQRGHRNYSEITAYKLDMDSIEFRKACIDLKNANAITCMEKFRDDDPFPILVYDIRLSDQMIKSL